jgi:hypothetical protein
MTRPHRMLPGRGTGSLIGFLALASTAVLSSCTPHAAPAPGPSPSRQAPSVPPLAVAFCVGGFPAGAPQRCGIEPAQIYFSGDHSVSIRDIIWSSWKASGAAGRGTWYLQACKPSCAQGPVIKYPAILTLSAARHGLFTVLAVTMKGVTTVYHYPVPWPQFGQRMQARGGGGGDHPAD